MLVDTDVLVWYLRGNKQAATFLGTNQGFQISVVTYMELVQGMRNKEELRRLRKTLVIWGISPLMIDERISQRAAYYVEEYFLSHALRLADALIAATAVERGLPLATANLKHYQVVADLKLITFQP